jgi:hypothetical protein
MACKLPAGVACQGIWFFQGRELQLAQEIVKGGGFLASRVEFSWRLAWLTHFSVCVVLFIIAKVMHPPFHSVRFLCSKQRPSRAAAT